MKTIFILFTAITLGLTSLGTEKALEKNDTLIALVVFDGYEGGYFFFTNSMDEPLVLMADKDATIECKRLKENEVAGKKFKIKYKKTESDEDLSNQGVLMHVILE